MTIAGFDRLTASDLSWTGIDAMLLHRGHPDIRTIAVATCALAGSISRHTVEAAGGDRPDRQMTCSFRCAPYPAIALPPAQPVSPPSMRPPGPASSAGLRRYQASAP